MLSYRKKEPVKMASNTLSHVVVMLSVPKLVRSPDSIARSGRRFTNVP